MQVQPGAGADLEQGQGAPGLARDREEAAEQHGAARHLVGLRRALEKAQQRRPVPVERLGDGSPQALTVGRHAARIDAREAR